LVLVCSRYEVELRNALSSKLHFAALRRPDSLALSLRHSKAQLSVESVSGSHGCEVQLRTQVHSQVQLGNEPLTTRAPRSHHARSFPISDWECQCPRNSVSQSVDCSKDAQSLSVVSSGAHGSRIGDSKTSAFPIRDWERGETRLSPLRLAHPAHTTRVRSQSLIGNASVPETLFRKA